MDASRLAVLSARAYEFSPPSGSRRTGAGARRAHSPTGYALQAACRLLAGPRLLRLHELREGCRRRGGRPPADCTPRSGARCKLARRRRGSLPSCARLPRLSLAALREPDAAEHARRGPEEVERERLAEDEPGEERG